MKSVALHLYSGNGKSTPSRGYGKGIIAILVGL